MSFILRAACVAVVLACGAPAAAQMPDDTKTVCTWRDPTQENAPYLILWRDAKGQFSAFTDYEQQVKGDGAGLFNKYGPQTLELNLKGPVVAGKARLDLVSVTARTMVDKGRSRPLAALRIAIDAGALKLGPYPLTGYAYALDQYAVSLHTIETGATLSPLKPAEAKALLAYLEKNGPVAVRVLQDGAEIGRLTFDTTAFEPFVRETRAWISANAAAYAATGRCADPKYDVRGD